MGDRSTLGSTSSSSAGSSSAYFSSSPARSLPQPRTLSEFRQLEGRDNRKRRLKALWQHIADCGYNFEGAPHGKANGAEINMAEELRAAYEHELMGRVCKDGGKRNIDWKEFRQYAEAKEVELWAIFHDELDLDGDGHLDGHELNEALRKTGIVLQPKHLDEFMLYLSSNPRADPVVTFSDFRDFLLLLPRKASPLEIYRYYQMNKYLGDDGRGGARVTMEGDVSLSAEDKPPIPPPTTASWSHPPPSPPPPLAHDEHDDDGLEDDEDEHPHGWLEGHTALKFLFAGGVAGAVSRSCTAPFDRLKIFLITRSKDALATDAAGTSTGGAKVLQNAISRIYAEGGVLAFWTGNGLSVTKIFPESAIKFFSYESSKRLFAQYWDHVEDSRDISGLSRFLSGGVGGITSQLCIYPIETLKTQMMSSSGAEKRTLAAAARSVYALGGLPSFYRGLAIGLVGVFPYSAIDMSTFEALKLAYLRSTGKEEPGVLALLAFGSLSGSVGATSVYPLNLVRTRLQASGSPGHPQRYTGVLDAAQKTYQREGWRGFYRGLFPTLAKVIPSVSISYVVYEHTKRKLGV
ncbi:mitochondrial carrier [Cylindrobasidium torrendii FP15055 ss-10]|uniref:Mitochondrial carrier n=1 Tax=Cylindrobasidium torrendii FP15055 ss-10 TaxID=1314674 RepID=A0A0D7BUE5_9AGAR|nr:mitochondrial carrier [Cylindrobasidium torrendii FP15055 ss-10]